MPRASAPLLRALLWLALGGWLGAALLFLGAVAPAAFSVTPSTEIAGNFVGRILPVVHVSAAVMGVAVALLGRRLGRRGALPLVLALGVAGLGTVSQWAVSPAIERLRPTLHTTEADPVLRARFGRLHALSMGLFAASVLAAGGLVVLHARADWREGAEKKREFS